MLDTIKLPDILLSRFNVLKHPELALFVRQVSTILGDNKLPFFPNYTDHGLRHVSRVLETITAHLIPTDTLECFTEADAIVLVSASLLHDLGMHIREDGFIKLIGGELPHRPILWFDRPGNERQPDLSWPEEWANYRSHIQRFGDQEYFSLLGRLPDGHDLLHWIDQPLPNDSNQWTQTDYLLIGEFLRRQHGRLAHEIAIFGFPGLSDTDFSILEKLMPKFADLSGLVARSHSLALREAASYLSYKHPRELRPRGATVLYHMALLRIGDYLQLDSERAPRILFKLRAPKVPASVDAWNQHGAVAHISFSLDDPAAIKIELDATHSLQIHLQLKSLIGELQKELDICSAVLSECYGRVLDAGLNRIRLDKYRVYSNHNEPALLDRLPFVPEAMRFDADPRIVSLMVGPIYGPFPQFGVRELLQNAVDAILERRQYLANRGLHDQLSENSPDIVVTLKENVDYGLSINFKNSGIGMTGEIIRGYFLRAGASFRDSRRWRQEFVDPAGKSQVRRSGRFGVGVFAGFLLGDRMEVITRWVGADFGVKFVATIDSELIELTKFDAPMGTSVTIHLSPQIAKDFLREVWPQCVEWYGLADPSVLFSCEIQRESSPDFPEPEPVSDLHQKVAIRESQLSGNDPGWSAFSPEGFARISWTSYNLIPQTDPRQLQSRRTNLQLRRLLGQEQIKLAEEKLLAEEKAKVAFALTNLHTFSFYEYNKEQAERRDRDERRRSSFDRERDRRTVPLRNERVYCNGFLIGAPLPPTNGSESKETDYSLDTDKEVKPSGLMPTDFIWNDSGPFARPSLMISDHEGTFPLTLRRDAILEPLPFQRGLEEDIVIEILAWFLACAPTGPLWSAGQSEAYLQKYPLVRGKHPLGTTLSWFCSKKGVGLLERGLLSRIRTEGLFLGGRTLATQRAVEIEGVWSDDPDLNLGTGILAVPSPRQIFHYSREERTTEDTAEFLAEYVAYLHGSPEFVIEGGLIARSGPNGHEEIRINNLERTNTDLNSTMGITAKATAHYSRAQGIIREARFSAEIKIKPTEGSSFISDVWTSFLGDVILPFAKKPRAQLVSAACQDDRIRNRYEKWRKWRSSAQFQPASIGYALMERDNRRN